MGVPAPIPPLPSDALRLSGRLTAVLTGPDGAELARREVPNTVLQTGAELVAQLLTGLAGAGPLNGVAVGLHGTPTAPPYHLTGLVTTSGDEALTGATVITLGTDAFTVDTQLDRLRVRIGVKAVLPAGAATGTIREAALGTLNTEGNALTRLYNRVILEPVEKAAEHELTLYWDVFLPYGT
jgi:hypothetical protein